MQFTKWSVALAGLLGLAACSDKGGDTSGDLVGDATAGETVFEVCAACHNADGSGQSGYSPSLVVEIPDQTDAELTDIILNGYGDMPAQDLTDQEVADVIAYCRATFP